MLKKILMMEQPTLYNYLVDELKNFGYNKINYQKEKLYIAAKGSIPIVLIAHLDTVFDEDTIPRSEITICHDKEQGIWWSPNGLGTDDKAGVAMILAILRQTDLRPHILFTTDEESFGAGAMAVKGLKQQLFGNDINYIIELDRQGYQECVFYQCDNKEFEQYINNFGFHTEEGTFTDISIICPDWGVAGVNLSVGYYWEHTPMEHFFEHVWADTYQRVVRMLMVADDKVWKYIPKAKEKKKYGSTRRERKSSN